MRESEFECDFKLQLARELCRILDGYSRDVAAASIGTLGTELSRIRKGDLRRFSVARLIRFVASTGYDIEVHLKKTPRLEERPKPRYQPVGIVRRYNYYGQLEGAETSSGIGARRRAGGGA